MGDGSPESKSCHATPGQIWSNIEMGEMERSFDQSRGWRLSPTGGEHGSYRRLRGCHYVCDNFHLPKWRCSDGEVHGRLEMSLFPESQMMNGN